MYLVKEDTAQPEQDLPLGDARPNITMRIRSKKFLVSYAAVKGASKCIRTELQMWRGFRLRPHAPSHRHRSRVATAAVSARLREGLAETRRRMYVKITCLQDALYKTINLSVFTTVHTRYKLCMWWRKIHFPCWRHCGFYQRVASFVDVLWTFMSQCKAPEGQMHTIMFLPFWKLLASSRRKPAVYQNDWTFEVL